MKYAKTVKKGLIKVNKEVDITKEIETIVNYCRERDCGEECKYYHEESNLCDLHNPSAWNV